MNEIFSDIPDDIKKAAEAAWQIALSKNPIEAAQFLSDITNYYRALNRSPEEIKFLQFYFNMKMEMMKNE